MSMLRLPSRAANRAPDAAVAEIARPGTETKSSIRASSGMLVGYALAQLVGFAAQIAIVRHLTKDQYGAFAWALSAVLLVQAVLPLGLDRASARFIAMYDEGRDYSRLFGVIAIELIVILGLGGVVGVAMALSVGPVGDVAPSDDAARLLAVLILLAPIQALDAIVTEMFAVFASPWSVFVRRYLLEPLLRLGVVVLLLTTDQDATFLAVGYVIVGAVGLLVFVVLLRRLFVRNGIAAHFSLRRLTLPWRDVAGFCGPLLLASFVAVGTTEFAGVILGIGGDSADVATYRAALPLAALNLAVMFSFTALFTPLASRLAARGDTGELRHLYWQTAAWIAVLTFPVFAVTTAFSDSVAVVTLGSQYTSSAPMLLIVSLAYYVNAALGFNGFTAQILGRGKWVLATNLVTLLTLVVSTLILVAYLDVIGAALAVLVTLAVHNLLKQICLGFGTGIGMYQRGHLLSVTLALAMVLILSAISAQVHLSLWVGLPLIFICWLVLLRTTRHTLRLGETFPEIERVPGLRWLVS